jgi:DNA-directed RNA polymerase subunit RPC12/RpoP
MSYLPCFLCGATLDKRTDKNRKPYFVCNPCGIQLFVRRHHGIRLLEKLLRDAAKHEVPFKERAEQIKRLQSQITILFADEDKVRACNLLKTKLENLFKELEQLAK